MADAKKTEMKKPDLFANRAKISLQARAGYTLPVRYQGAWVRVTKDKAEEFVIAELAYESKIEIKAGIEAEHIYEPKDMPAPKVEAKAVPDAMPVEAKAEAKPKPSQKV